MGIPIGIVAAVIAYFAIQFRVRHRIDDPWTSGRATVWGHMGTLATGLFATLAVNSRGADGLIGGNAHQFLIQLAAAAVIWVFAFSMTWIIGKLIDITIGLRVNETEEAVGLDISQHGESAYGDEF